MHKQKFDIISTCTELGGADLVVHTPFLEFCLDPPLNFISLLLCKFPISIPLNPPLSTSSLSVSKLPAIAALCAGVSQVSFLCKGFAPLFMSSSVLALKIYEQVPF